eukprot:361973-Chlamydomonas_euryale.AAC.8
MTVCGRVGGSTSVCVRSSSVGAEGRRRLCLQAVNGHWVGSERWGPFTVQSHPDLYVYDLSWFSGWLVGWLKKGEEKGDRAECPGLTVQG